MDGHDPEPFTLLAAVLPLLAALGSGCRRGFRPPCADLPLPPPLGPGEKGAARRGAHPAGRQATHLTLPAQGEELRLQSAMVAGVCSYRDQWSGQSSYVYSSAMYPIFLLS